MMSRRSVQNTNYRVDIALLVTAIITDEKSYKVSSTRYLNREDIPKLQIQN